MPYETSETISETELNVLNQYSNKNLLNSQLNSQLNSHDNKVNYKNLLQGTCINSTISGSTSECNCTYPTSQADCFGYFIPSSESLCGATAMEGHSGGCCMYDTENNTIIPCQTTTYCGCHSIAAKFNFAFNWTRFLAGQSCKDIDCFSSVSGLGACCDGKGLCSETTQSICENNKMFFQGIGTRCFMGEKSICIEGTGGCCDGTTLELGVVGASCLESGKIFTGIQRNAQEFYTGKENLSCEYVAVPLTELKFGDLVAGGMFIGVYSPGRSICYGRDVYNFTNINEVLDGSTQESVLYFSRYDWRGYGSERNNRCNTEDSYAMILSLDSMTVEHVDDLTRRIIEIDTFSFSRGGLDWGPQLSVSGRILETNPNEIKNTKEGYYLNQTIEIELNKKHILAYRCDEKRNNGIDLKHDVNGNWSTSWGFNNTSRINSAELFSVAGLTLQELTSEDYKANDLFDSITTTPMIVGLREINRKLIINQENESSWYIPALDELSYISYLCKYKNLNQILINSEGAPITGTHWSSTGSFSDSQGIFTGSTAAAGSVAWTVTFPYENNVKYITKKSNRTEKNKVRPIKFIRCDSNSIPQINKKLPVSL